MRLAGIMLLVLALLIAASAYGTEPNHSNPAHYVSSPLARRLLGTSYAPPFPVRTASWYLQGIPLSPRERMSQSLCCGLLPNLCGMPQCHAAAMGYFCAFPKHLDPDYLKPFRRAPDPAQETRSLIFWAMNPVPSARTDFLPTYRLYVLGDDIAPHE